ncbi:MAG: hypothetical protein ABLQ96_12185, partial [Candidatus Acidiferrum sp.]
MAKRFRFVHEVGWLRFEMDSAKLAQRSKEEIEQDEQRSGDQQGGRTIDKRSRHAAYGAGKKFGEQPEPRLFPGAVERSNRRVA